MIEIGLKHTSELTVTDAVTAIQMGSGDMPVLATPAMIEFKAAAYSGNTLLGEGTHLRLIVDREKFMSRLG